MSLAIDSILAVLRDGGHLTDTKALQAAAKDLIAAEREAKEEKSTEKRGKTRLVGLVRMDAGERVDLGGVYLLSVPDLEEPEGDTYAGESLLSRLRKAAIAHNEQPRKRRGKPVTKVETWDQFFRGVKARTLKESGSAITVRAKGNAHELIVLDRETIAAP